MTESHGSTAMVLGSLERERGAREGRGQVMDNAKYSDGLVVSATIGVKNMAGGGWEMENFTLM